MSGRVLRVGVTGHRVFRDPERVARTVRAGLDRLVALTAGGPGETGAPGAPGEAGETGETPSASVRLEVLTSLSEGADRLVARAALALPGTTLVAVLPVPADDYARDFGTRESRSEFEELLARARAVETMPPARARDTAYAAQGQWIADHSDVLVALWDGEPSHGRGGTAEIVAHAADRGTLLLWIRVVRP